jgi:tetratricopeptide (TPR) repeat protein
MRKAIWTVLLLTASMTFAAQPGENEFARGRAAMMSGEFDAAVTAFEKAVRLNGRSADYHFWLGRAYGEQAQRANVFKQAVLAKKTKAEFERAVELDPNHLEARFALIDYYLIAPAMMGGSEEKARQQAEEIRKRNLLDGHRAFGRVYTRQKKYEQATQEFAAAVREQPNSAKAHYYLGGALMNEKKYPAAAAELDTAIRLDPSFMPAYFRIGALAATANNNLARGEEALKKYLAHKPGDDEPSLGRAWYWLGNIYEKQGKKAEARQSYGAALKLMPTSKEISEALKRVS